jgi:hypothetical protein
MELETYETDEKSGDIDLKALKEDFEEPFNLSELCRVLLTVMEAKPATDVEGFFSSVEKFEDFVSRINSAGFNCYVERDPEDTNAESFAQFFDEEDRKRAIEKIENAEVKSRIFITPESYEEEIFRLIAGESYGSDFHRKYGEFLRFDDENIEAFTYFMMSRWRKLLYRLKDGKPPEALMPLEAIEKYRPDAGKPEKEFFTAFTFQKIADRREKFEEAYTRVEERKEKVENSDIDLDFVVDALQSFQLLEEDEFTDGSGRT